MATVFQRERVLEGRISMLEGLLRDLQWAGSGQFADQQPACPCCLALRGDGLRPHRPGCDLAKMVGLPPFARPGAEHPDFPVYEELAAVFKILDGLPSAKLRAVLPGLRGCIPAPSLNPV